jgi:hypothetical protein
VPRLCEFYPGICLTTEEKARKNLSEVKKNLSQSTVYLLPKDPYITKPTHAHALARTEYRFVSTEILHFFPELLDVLNYFNSMATNFIEITYK